MASHKAVDQLREELRERISQYCNFDPTKSPNYNLKIHPNLAVSICNPSGCHVSQINAVGCFKPVFSKWKNADHEVKFIEPLLYYQPAGLIVLVRENSSSATFTLEVENTQNGTIIETDIFYWEPVLSCTSNKYKLVVCLSHYICIYSLNFRKKPLRNSEVRIRVPKNEHGLCALGTGHLAFPGQYSRGVVDIRDADDLHRELYLYAHDEPLIALAFNAIGTRLATATHDSIRVFPVGKWKRIYEFRINIPEIPKLYFSFGYIACSSKSATIHIFKLAEENQDSEASGSTSAHSDKQSYSLTVTEPHPIQKVVAVKFVYQVLYLFVISATGVFVAYKYNTTTEKFVPFCIENITAKLLVNTPMTTSSDEDEDGTRTV